MILPLLTGMLTFAYLPFEVELPTAAYWILGALTAILLLASVLLHELGHLAAAARFKIPVRRSTLFVFGGIAGPSGKPPSALTEFLVAVTGPTVSFALAALFGVLAVVSGVEPPLFVLAKDLAIVNGSLALLNLVPGLPLDGGRALRAIVWRMTGSLKRATTITVILGQLTALLVLAVGIWQILTGDLAGLLIALAGWSLRGAATQTLREEQLVDVMADHSVADVTGPGYVRVSAETPLQELVDRQLPNVGARGFLVQRNGTIVGLLTWRHINAVPSADWQTTTAAQAMTPVVQTPSIQPEEETARERVDQRPIIAAGGQNPA